MYSGGPRQLAIRWRRDLSNVRVEIAGRTLALFESCSALSNGARIAVDRHASVGIRWIPTAENFAVDLNGVAIRGVREVYPDTSDAARTVLVIGWVNAIVGAGLVAAFGPWVADSFVFGVLFLVLGFFVRRDSRVALGLAIGVLALALLTRVVVMTRISAPSLPVALVFFAIFASSLLAMIRAFISSGSKV